MTQLTYIDFSDPKSAASCEHNRKTEARDAWIIEADLLMPCHPYLIRAYTAFRFVCLCPDVPHKTTRWFYYPHIRRNFNQSQVPFDGFIFFSKKEAEEAFYNKTAFDFIQNEPQNIYQRY